MLLVQSYYRHTLLVVSREDALVLPAQLTAHPLVVQGVVGAGSQGGLQTRPVEGVPAFKTHGAPIMCAQPARAHVAVGGGGYGRAVGVVPQ